MPEFAEHLHRVRMSSQDWSIRLWNWRTRVCVIVINGEGGHVNEVLSLVRQALLATPRTDEMILSNLEDRLLLEVHSAKEESMYGLAAVSTIGLVG